MGTLKTYEQIIADCSECDPVLADVCLDKICTEAVNLLWLHENAPVRDPKSRDHLLSQIRSRLPDYLRSSRYGIGRKIQAILAAVSPRVFTRVKNLLHKRLI